MAFVNPVKSQSAFTYEGSTTPPNPSQGQTWRERNASTGLIVCDWERASNEWITLQKYLVKINQFSSSFEGIYYESMGIMPGNFLFLESVHSLLSFVNAQSLENYFTFELHQIKRAGTAFAGLMGTIDTKLITNNTNTVKINWNTNKTFSVSDLGNIALKIISAGSPGQIDHSTVLTFRGIR